MDIYRVIKSFLRREADARKNLKGFLASKIRPELIDKFEPRSIFRGIVNMAEKRLGHIDEELFLQDLIDYLWDHSEDMLVKIMGALRGTLSKKGFSDEEIDIVIDPRKKLEDELESKMDKVRSDVATSLGSYLKNIFKNLTKKWLTKKVKEPSLEYLMEKRKGPTEEREEEEPDVSVGEGFKEPGSEAFHEQMLKEIKKWRKERQLAREVRRFIDKETSGKTQEIYRKILDERYLTDKPKTLQELSKDFDISIKGIQKHEMNLLKILREYLTGQVKETPKVHEKAPDYKTVLKDKDDSEDFKKFMKKELSEKRITESNRNILNMLAEGKSIDDIASKLDVSKHIVYKMIKVWFKKIYQKWYDKHAGKIKDASERIISVYMKLSDINKFEQQVLDNLNKKPFRIYIYFSSDYDNITVTKGDKDPAKDDPNFHYLKYMVNFDFDRYKHTLDYKYERDLDKEGNFTGSGQSRLEVDLQKRPNDDDLKKNIDDFIERKVIPEGMIPHDGFKVIYRNQTRSSAIPVDRKTVRGIERFVELYRGLGYADPRHKERMKAEEERKERLRLKKWGPGTSEIETSKVRKLLSEVQQTLRMEKGKSEVRRDKGKIKELEEYLKKLKDHLKKKEKLEIDEIEEIREREKEFRKWEKEEAEKEASIVDEVEDYLEKLRADQAFRVAMRFAFSYKDILKDSENVKEFKEFLKPKLEQTSDINREIINQLAEGKDVGDIAGTTVKIKQTVPGAPPLRKPKEVEKDMKLPEATVKRVRDAFFEKLFTSWYRQKTALKLPRVQTEGGKEFEDMLKRYKLEVPVVWPSPAEVKALARAFRIQAEEEILKEIKKLRGKGKEDKARELRTDLKKDVEKAPELFKKYIKDLKARRDKMKEESAIGYEKYFKGKDSGWVDEESSINDVIGHVEQSLEKTVRQLTEVPPKEVSVQMIEKPKFKGLEAFLVEVQSGISQMANRLNKASMHPVGPREQISVLNQEKEKIRSYMTELGTKLSDLKDALSEGASRSKGTEEGANYQETLKNIDKLEDEVSKVNQKFKSTTLTEKSLSAIPAADAAQALKFHIDYFNKLYNLFHSYFWFREKKVVQGAEKEEQKKRIEWGEGTADPAKFEPLRKKIVDMARQISETGPLRSYNSYSTIRGLLNKVRPMVNDFIMAFPKVRSAYMTEDEIETGIKPVYLTVVEAAEKDREKAIEKTVFPENELEYARSLVKKLRDHKFKKVKEMAPKAEQELSNIVKRMTDAFKEGLPIDRLRSIAEKSNISLDEARSRSKKHQDAMAQVAMRKFTDKWREVLEKGRPVREKSPLGNRPATEYNQMGEYVERHLPSLFELVPGEEKLEDLPMAKPTKSDIIDAIMEGIEKRPGKAREYYDDKLEEIESFGFHGTEKGKTKGRPKPPKMPIPKGTWQDLKDQVVKIFQKHSADDIVHIVMAHHVQRIKKLINKAREEGKYIDPDTVIDSLVSLLKNLKFVIVNMRVSPSIEQMKMLGPRPPSGGPTPETRPMGEPPDIPIDNYEDAVKVLDKIKDIYDEINYYIAPDKVGEPPADISKITYKPGKKDLPFGFAEWAEKLRQMKDEKKTAGRLKADIIVESFLKSSEYDPELVEESLLILE